MGGFEAAGFVFDSSGEGALDVPEQLAFQQAFVQRAAVDAHIRAVGAVGEHVYRAGNKLFSCSGFTYHQNRGLSGCHAADQTEDFRHGRSGTHHSRQGCVGVSGGDGLELAHVRTISSLERFEAGSASKRWSAASRAVTI